MPAFGIGIIDTSTLWAAGTLTGSMPYDLTGDTVKDFLRHPNREIYSTNNDYLVSLLHNLLLYDELRTDVDVLTNDLIYGPVRELIRKLSSVIKIDPIPQTFSEKDILEAICPAFVSKTRTELESGRPSVGVSQIAVAASNFHGIYNSGVAGLLPEEQLDRILESLSENTRNALIGLAGDLGSDLSQIASRHSILSAIFRNLSIIARTVRYVGHSRSVHTTEKRPSAFCASPRRIELLQGYLDKEYLETLRAGVADFVDLFSRLGLPKSGYDFAGFAAAIKPISLSDLSYAVSKLAPQKALDRVLEIRGTSEALAIRRIWAERLWRGGEHVLEGYGYPITASMRNIRADGDVIQIIATETGSEVALNRGGLKREEANGIYDAVRRIKERLRDS
jgi:hypothetical protein